MAFLCYKDDMKTLYFKIIMFLFLSACKGGDLDSKSSVNSVVPPSQIAAPTKAKDFSDDNYFSDRAHWGEYRQFVDFSGSLTLGEDPRVDDYYKINLPRFAQNYVLWRVNHDGSCWIQSAMVVIMHGILSLEKSQFEEALLRWKNYAAKLSEEHLAFKKFEESGELKKFFDLIEVLGRTADFKKALDMLNHMAINDLFNRSLRIFIDPSEEETSLCEFGDISRARVLTDIIGVPFLGFSAEGNLEGHAPALGFIQRLITEKTLLSLDKNYWLQQIQKLGRSVGVDAKVDPNYSKKYHDLLEKLIDIESDKLPKVIYLRSRHLYMDITVLKTYSDKINNYSY